MRDTIYLGDCLSVMEAFPDHSVNAAISDLPYGTTYAPWDSVIPLEALWAALKRVLVPGGAVVLTASQPFTSALVASNFKWFRCKWIWNKVNAANFANAKRQPLKVHESVLVFCEKQPHPACGSGSTCEAARLEERHFVGIDNDPKCFDTAAQRLGLLEKQ
jgi:site-specific DNA-methyltransferase (adenine-specific)